LTQFTGYSVASGMFMGSENGEYTVAGVPRYELRGTVSKL